jgi:parallel beta-helix repeat protein
MQPRRYLRQLLSITSRGMITASLLGTPLVHAATYYVATNGSDSRTCTQAQNPSTPKRTINNGRTCLAAGDTLSVMGGTYDETLVNPLPSGLSASQPTTLTGFSATNRPVLKPTGGNSYIIQLSQTRSNVRFRHLVLDARSFSGTLNGAFRANGGAGITGLTLEDCEAIGWAGVGSTGSGISIGGGNSGTIRRCAVHDWVSPETNPGAHGIYWQGRNGLIESNRLYGNNGLGIQFYSSSGTGVNGNTFRNNCVHHNGKAGLYIGTGSDNTAYNNVLVHNATGVIAVGTRTRLYNNTIVSNGSRGIVVRGSQAESRNNIVDSHGAEIVNEGSGAIFSNNLCDTGGGVCQYIGTPSFVDASGGDYHLQSHSPAIDSGMMLSAVKTDFDGVQRPQDAAYDIGAYEFGLTPPNNPCQ